MSTATIWLRVVFAVMVCMCNTLLPNENISDAAIHRHTEEKIRFSVVSKRLKEKHFHLMFRMDRECFDALCDTIKNAVGEKEFKSEAYLQELYHMKTKEGQMYRCNILSTGGYICGEIKVAVALRILAGGSYLDVACIFGIHHRHVPKIFQDVAQNWFCLDEVSRLVLDDALENCDQLIEIASDFNKSSRCPSFTGIIGVLDGWLVRIRLSSIRRVLNNISTGGYWSRKGFYALNIQVICDKHKRIIWRSINSKGGEHDSKAFKSTKLWKKLTDMACDPASVFNRKPFGLHFYILADLAYALRSFLLTPYPNAVSGSAEDAFNYFHSSNRITVECCFGEIHARWGIFWKPLQYDITTHKYIIDSAFKLHNFIVNYRLNKKGNENIEPFKKELMVYMANQTHKDPVGIFHHPDIGNGNGGEGRGRPSKIDEDLRNRGKQVRDDIRDHINMQGLCRPRFRHWGRNDCNFVEMTMNH